MQKPWRTFSFLLVALFEERPRLRTSATREICIYKDLKEISFRQLRSLKRLVFVTHTIAYNTYTLIKKIRFSVIIVKLWNYVLKTQCGKYTEDVLKYISLSLEMKRMAYKVIIFFSFWDLCAFFIGILFMYLFSSDSF